MRFSLVRLFQWLGVAAGLFLLVGLNYEFESDAGETINAPVEDSLSQSLLGYWKMDEGTGTSTTADSSGNSNNLTMTNADAEDWQAGQIGGYSLDFNGTDEWLTVADPSSGILDFADGRDFSISGWFNRDTEDTLDTLVAKRNGDAAGDTGYMIWLGTNDFLNFEISDGTDQYIVTSSSTYATTGWHQFVATWKDSLGMYLYVDGASVGSNTASTSSIGSLANAVTFRIAAESSTGTENPFDGKIDDVKLYSHALSANEVSRLYQTTVPGSPVDTGLVGHWTFDGNDVNWGDTGSEIKDVSGKGNHGDALGSLATTSVRIGKLGQGLSFDGNGDYVAVPTKSSLNVSGVSGIVTIVAWVKYDKIIGDEIETIVMWEDYLGGNGNESVRLFEQAHFSIDYSTPVFGITDVSSNLVELPATDTVGKGEWHHLAGVYDGTNQIIYVDGSESNSVVHTGGIKIPADGAENVNWLIGSGELTAPTRVWNGSIDDVRIYNRALSAVEVLNLYNLGR